MNNQYQSSLKEFQSYQNQQNSYMPNISNIMTKQPKVVLFLFPPKQLSKQYKRPLMYDFNYQMIDATQKCVSRAIDDYGKRNIYEDTFINSYPESALSIMPTTHGLEMHTDYMSVNWTFMLVNDNEPLDNMQGINGIVTMSQRETRKICVGYCNGEPIDGMNNLNPNCVLTITHYSNIFESIQETPMGALKDNIVNSNVDVIHSNINSMVNNDLYKTDPLTLQQSVTVDSGINLNNYETSFNEPVYNYSETDNYISSLGNNINLANSNTISISDVDAKMSTINEPIKYRAKLNSPDKILHGIVYSSVEGLMNSSILDDSDPYHTGIYNSNPNISKNIESALEAYSSLSRLNSKIIPDKSFTIGTLKSFYPYLEIQRISRATTDLFDPYDQAIPNITNQLSSLVSSSLPTMLADIGLMSVAFRYDSVSINSFGMKEEKGVYELMNIESFTTLTPNLLAKKWELLKIMLERSLFKTLKLAAGEFNLICSCSNGDTNLITMNFYDFNGINNHIYESSNRLGGFNSPLIGGQDVFMNNANQLYGLKETITSL